MITDDFDLALEQEIEKNRNRRKYNEMKMKLANECIPARIKDEVNSIINKEFPPNDYTLGLCHKIWARKVELYEERGYKWYSPAAMNPFILYD